MTETRKLAAILAADVAGYSRLTGADEEGTLARMRALRSELIDPAISANRGRVANTAGDSILVEFVSVVDAVRAAIDIQRAMTICNADFMPEKRIEFRIGIHLGDVMVESDGDLRGDGVNIAARLEGIAEPSGICVSDDAQRQTRGKIDVTFEDTGPQSLKNLAEPMRVWRLRIDGHPAAPATSQVGAAQPLALPDKPSIAVLPFQNMSGDPEQEYFTDGMVEEIITALARIRWLFVIARNSTFTYKGRAVDVKQVGRELGVRYVLEGSVRKGGNRLRITAQLIEAETGAHLWADRFDGSLEDVFELQDQVALSVAGVIEPALQAAEIRRATARPTNDLTAYDLYLRSIGSLVLGAGKRTFAPSTCWSRRSSAIRATVSPSRERRFVIRKSSSRAGPRIPSRAGTRVSSLPGGRCRLRETTPSSLPSQPARWQTPTRISSRWSA